MSPFLCPDLLIFRDSSAQGPASIGSRLQAATGDHQFTVHPFLMGTARVLTAEGPGYGRQRLT